MKYYVPKKYLCPICGNEIFAPRDRKKPFRCKWCHRLIESIYDCDEIRSKDK